MTTQVTKTKSQRSLTGKVISTKMDKTIVVEVSEIHKDIQYGKYRKLSRKFFAHDAENKCQLDDVVVIKQAKPYSKRTTWEVVGNN